MGNNRTANRELQVLSKIKQRLNSENLIICKADKGNTVTILNKKDYQNKMYDFLETLDATKLTKDPTDKFNTAVNTALSN